MFFKSPPQVHINFLLFKTCFSLLREQNLHKTMQTLLPLDVFRHSFGGEKESKI